MEENSGPELCTVIENSGRQLRGEREVMLLPAQVAIVFLPNHGEVDAAERSDVAFLNVSSTRTSMPASDCWNRASVQELRSWHAIGSCKGIEFCMRRLRPCREGAATGDQMKILVLNPGGNSLKVEVVVCLPGQTHAFEGRKLLSVSMEGIGSDPKFLRYEGKKVVETEEAAAESYEQAAANILARMHNDRRHGGFELGPIDCVGVRVVHGGSEFGAPAEITAEVEAKIVSFERLAPLHNKSSVEILGPIRKQLPNVPIYAVFDTAFHRTIPEYAARYAIPLQLADKHGIRRYGFHGIAHRYLLERYAAIAGKPVEDCNLVSMHLESGCSVTAIRNGKSIDNTMGLTPLEGLMMGTRSGDIDPSVLPLLVNDEGMTIDEVMTMLNKESGLKGVSQLSLDTRVLMKHYNSDPKVKLAMDMFSYRLLKAVGAQLAAVGSAEAIIFGGGIAENTSLVRSVIGDGLRWCGFWLDAEANRNVIDREGRLSTQESPLQAWVIPAEEGLQIAHECCGAFNACRS